ncbi:MAG TPA: pyridoxamine 5'-phosphate oxidase family protein [archaeon]|nr:pyridoxamine 5'-phosphate oxidase family protein [archaeon]
MEWENSYLDLERRREEDLRKFSPEINITNEMKEVLESTYNPFFSVIFPYRVIYMGTADDEGNPNITLVSFAKVMDRNKIIIPDGAFLKSRMNIEINPIVSLTALSYRKFELMGSLGTKILSKLLANFSPDSSSLDTLRNMMLYPFFQRVKRKTPSIPLHVSPLPYYKVRGWEFKGNVEYLKEGEDIDKMNKFGKKLFGEGFQLYGIVLLHVREVFDAFSGIKIQGR